MKSMNDAIAKLVTGQAELRGDIDKLRTELKGDVKTLRTELKGDFNALRTELKGDISTLRTEVKGDINTLRTEMGTLRAEMKGCLEALEKKDHPVVRCHRIQLRRVGVLGCETLQLSQQPIIERHDTDIRFYRPLSASWSC